MSNIDLHRIANSLMNVKCPIHGASASVRADGLTVFYDDVCCTELKQQLDETYENMVEKEVQNYFENMYSK